MGPELSRPLKDRLLTCWGGFESRTGHLRMAWWAGGHLDAFNLLVGDRPARALGDELEVAHIDADHVHRTLKGGASQAVAACERSLGGGGIASLEHTSLGLQRRPELASL